MNRKQFVQNSAKAMVATAFLTSPFSRLFAAKQSTMYDYIVFERVDDYAINAGNTPNTYHQLFYFPNFDITEDSTRFYSELIEVHAQNGNTSTLYEASYTSDDYSTDYEYDSYAKLQQDTTDFDFDNMDSRFSYLNELTKVEFGKGNNEILLYYGSSSRNLVATYGYKQTEIIDLSSDFSFTPPSLGSSSSDETNDDDYWEDCFLTSACVFHKGLPDNCSELTILRNFRDQYMAKTAYGKQLINDYYQVGPATVQAIHSHPQKAQLFTFIYDQLIQPSITFIQQGKEELAMEYYQSFTKELHRRLLG